CPSAKQELAGLLAAALSMRLPTIGRCELRVCITILVQPPPQVPLTRGLTQPASVIRSRQFAARWRCAGNVGDDAAPIGRGLAAPIQTSPAHAHRSRAPHGDHIAIMLPRERAQLNFGGEGAHKVLEGVPMTETGCSDSCRQW